MRAVLDTNLLVDYLGGIDAARLELDRYREPCISIVTWMEVLGGASDADDEAVVRAFLDRFEVLAPTGPIAERAVTVRREHRIRLPDAVIWATALVHELLLVTRNTRDFPTDHPGVRVPYRL